MADINRRKLLKCITLLTGFTFLPGCSDVEQESKSKAVKGYELPINRFDGVHVLSNLIDSKEKLQKKLDVTVSSKAFKQAYKKMKNLNKRRIFTVIEQDFEKGLTTEFNGFVFSNTEVALYVFHQQAA